MNMILISLVYTYKIYFGTSSSIGGDKSFNTNSGNALSQNSVFSMMCLTSGKITLKIISFTIILSIWFPNSVMTSITSLYRWSCKKST